MMNQYFGVGRLVEDPKVEITESGKEVTRMPIAVQRSYKNADGEYDTDFFDVVLWNSLAVNTSEYCHKGDLVGVKGRLESNTYETKDGEKKKSTYIVAEKISFLASKKSKESEADKSDDDLDM